MPLLHPLYANNALLIWAKETYYSVNSYDFTGECYKFDEIREEISEKDPKLNRS